MTAAHNDRRTSQIVERLLRVNFVGEQGAIQIYRMQSALARWLCPELAAELADILAHEQEHRAIFGRLIAERGASPCRCGLAWSLGGVMLGLITGLFGRAGVMVCTDAVERTVDRHLNQQLRFLDRCDLGAAAAIRAVQAEEQEHVAFARGGLPRATWVVRAAHGVIAAVTDVLIWLSTVGDSARLEQWGAAPPEPQQ